MADPIDLRAIKARLGSIPAPKMNAFPMSVIRLLEVDFPAVIAELEEAREVIERSLS